MPTNIFTDLQDRARLAIILMAAFSGLASLSDLALSGQQRLSNDEIGYSGEAERLRVDHRYTDSNGNPQTNHPPLYPLFLSCFYSDGSIDGWRTRLAQAVLLAGTVLLAGAIGWQLCGAGTAVLSATFLATYYPLIRISHRFLTEVVTVPLAMAALLSLLLAVSSKRHQGILAFTSGVFFALMSLTRIICFPLVALGIIALLLKRQQRPALMLFLAFALSYSPWIARNYIASGKLTIMSSLEERLVSNRRHVDDASLSQEELWFVHGDYVLERMARGATFQDARDEWAAMTDEWVVSQRYLGRGMYSRFSWQNARYAWARLAIMLGAHPGLDLPFPLAGHAAHWNPTLRRANYVWTLLLFLGCFIGLGRSVFRRQWRVLLVATFPVSLIFLYAFAHAIPRYQIVPYALLCPFSACGWFCFLNDLLQKAVGSQRRHELIHKPTKQ